MVNVEKLIARDLHHIWHPCSQMKDFENCPPLVVERAQGSYLYTNQGPIIDAISSWWCKSLGHNHPAVIAAMKEQLYKFEHVIGANTTFPALVELGEQLAEITGNQHAYFACDGSSAVEIAMKLALHGTKLRGLSDKTEFIALKNGYHGETLGTMSVSDLGIYKQPYEDFGVTCHFIDNIPYVSGETDLLWQHSDPLWPDIMHKLNQLADRTCAIILEPLIQGAGGMLCYSADFLSKLALWAKTNNIYVIADEIMTGMGRTGTWLACEHADVQADLICLSKGLTSGAAPLSCVMLNKELYQLFYSDYKDGKSFLHSNTYSGYPLGVCAALATIKTIQSEHILQQAQQLGKVMREQLTQVAAVSGKLSNIRSLGAMVAADLIPVANGRVGHEIYQQALKLGALLRPIGNTLYWLPPLNTDIEIIGKLSEITLNSINNAYKKLQNNVDIISEVETKVS